MYVVKFQLCKDKNVHICTYIWGKKRKEIHMSIVAIFWKVGFISSSPFFTMSMCYFDNGVKKQDKSSIKPNQKKSKEYEYLLNLQNERGLQV